MCSSCTTFRAVWKTPRIKKKHQSAFDDPHSVTVFRQKVTYTHNCNEHPTFSVCSCKIYIFRKWNISNVIRLPYNLLTGPIWSKWLLKWNISNVKHFRRYIYIILNYSKKPATVKNILKTYIIHVRPSETEQNDFMFWEEIF